MIPSPAFYLALSEVLQERRSQLGINQTCAAKRTGIGVKTISSNERGRPFTLDNLLRYCHGYEIEVQVVLEEAERRTPVFAERLAEAARRKEEARLATERRALRPGKRVSLKRSVSSGSLRSSLDPSGAYVVLAGRTGG